MTAASFANDVEAPLLCLWQHIAAHAHQNPAGPALLAPERTPLTYAGLHQQITDTVDWLNAHGLGRNDRIAAFLPDGPEAAVALLAISAGATCVPLDPSAPAAECRRLLATVNAQALLLPVDSSSPAVAVGRELAIPILELVPDSNGQAGQFSLAGKRRTRTISASRASLEEVAILLHTSGTAATPRRVPLTHQNLASSAFHIARALELTAADRCLNVMPLFHIHGQSMVYASVVAGASIISARPFSEDSFFTLFDTFQPTWYSAAPAIHQAILAAKERTAWRPRRSALRFLRSASAAMPSRLLRDLEQAFGAPVLEAYGMTEAGPQIASNRLAPEQRREGSVGKPAGPEVAIMDEAGRLLPAEHTGEVVIRGANVMQGYDAEEVSQIRKTHAKAQRRKEVSAQLVKMQRREEVQERQEVQAHGREEPTANQQAFVQGWFRTGDLGYLDRDGFLFITSRLKDVINRGGEKVTPRYVDEILLEHPAIAQAVTFPVPHPLLGEAVAAAVVLKSNPAESPLPADGISDRETLARSIRQFAAERLAPACVPQQVVIVDHIPQAAGGKIRRGELADRLKLTSELLRDHSIPRPCDSELSPTEKKVCEIWKEVLGVEPGLHDDFFHLGGHSLAATRIAARLRDIFHIDIALEHFFTYPTIAAFTRLVRDRVADMVASGNARLLPALTSHDSVRRTHHREPGVPHPLSFTQQRLWFLHQVEIGDAYHMSASLRLSGTLDVAVLERCLSDILRRHDVLRATFALGGQQPIQCVAPACPVLLPVIDLTTRTPAESLREARRIAEQELHRPFDLERGPVFRSLLVRRSDQEHWLLLTVHHIVFDAWSTRLLHRELSQLYRAYASGRPSPLPELPLQFADLAVQQNETLSGNTLAQQLAYWRDQMRDHEAVLMLPADRPRGAERTYRGAAKEFVIDAQLVADLKHVSRDFGVTLFMTTLAAFKTFLLRYSGQEDCVVGTPIANRTCQESEALIGCFANTLALRTNLAGDPLFPELLERVRATTMGAYRHADLPFNVLVDELQLRRDTNHMPLFQVMFAFQNVPAVDSGVTTRARFPLDEDLFAQPLEIDRATAKFDLTLYLSEIDGQLSATWQYNADLFEAATIERFARHFEAILERVAGAPHQRLSDLMALPESDKQRMLVESSSDGKHLPPQGRFYHFFEYHAAHTPDATAVSCGNERLTYRQLNARANQLARYLQKRSVARGTLVGICLPRCVNMVVALIAVAKAGGTFLVLDPDYPLERLAYLCCDARVSTLLSDKATLARLAELADDRAGFAEFERAAPAQILMDAEEDAIASEESLNLRGHEEADDLAYIIYTSGSTGVPKGVMITHGNLYYYVQALRDALGILPSDRYLHTASFAFSSSVRQFTVPLCSGAEVVIAAADEIRDPLRLMEHVRRSRVTVMDLVPSYWQACVDAMSRAPVVLRETLLANEVRLIASASEPLPARLPREWASVLGSDAHVINMYGQTETTGIVAVYPIPSDPGGSDNTVPIGRPLAGTRIVVCDSAGQLVPVGVPGEICVEGRGVGRGYVNQPALTAERFVRSPYSDADGGTLYRTGDRGRWRTDGSLEILGRTDEQIKLRGYRVEPGEIESILRQDPEVRDCVVIVQEVPPDPDEEHGQVAISRRAAHARLVAFVEPVLRHAAEKLDAESTAGNGAAQQLAQRLRDVLKSKLPNYMVPATVRVLAVLPRTLNGKIDRSRLKSHLMGTDRAVDYDNGQPVSVPRKREPHSVTEHTLFGIWKRLLQLDELSIDDNFFDLGGDSLLSVRMVAEAQAAGLSVNLKQFFEHQTIAELAAIQTDSLANVSRVAEAASPPQQDAAHDSSVFSATASATAAIAKSTVLRATASKHSAATTPITEARASETPVAEQQPAGPTILLSAASLRAFGCEALEHAGLAPDVAAIVTEVQLEANLRGQLTHNMASIPRYARRVAAGIINARPTIRVEVETATTARVDGDNGPGQWVATMAMDMAIQKARSSGIGIVTARRSNHLGAAGHYAWQAAREGLVGLCTTNGPVILAPTGGRTATFGNNPLAVGIPAGNYHPILLDVAMSVAPRGRIALQVAAGKALPPGWILDRDGRPSTDLADLAAGLGVPIGGHKGYGLALVLEVLSGVLSGAGFCLDHQRESLRQNAGPSDLGHFFLAFDPALFMPGPEFRSRVDRLIEQTKAGERQESCAELLVPGEAELRTRERSQRLGVPILRSACRVLQRYARETGLSTTLIELAPHAQQATSPTESPS